MPDNEILCAVGDGGRGYEVKMLPGTRRITCQIPERTDLSMAVFNLSGKKTGSLLHRTIENGSYVFSIDTRLPWLKNGIYVIKVFTDKKTAFSGKYIIL